MTNRLQAYRSLVNAFDTSLKAFQSSGSKFRVLKTIHPADPYAPRDPTVPSPEEQPRTLIILDSSFNPPSLAHQTMIESTLLHDVTVDFPKPHRLLLLFATMNADKAPSAASFDHRLTMMTIFAGDLLAGLQSDNAKLEAVPIDIGVTTVPYYTDKSHAIETEGRDHYTKQPKHIHLIGFDTLTRFFGAKYYKSFDPPLSALSPYFDQGGHQLRVTLRPDPSETDSEDEQRAFLDRLAAGDMEKDGAKRQWARQINLVSANDKAGVSSTRIRKAAKNGTWDEVADLCPPTVVEWVRSYSLYGQDDEGAKTA